ncbi:hypothetical protein DRH14_02230 [Candidatus Shapirobacteria bacterium]|nr:MAG: hypothetical protein DRH14_02230 [Candidatus Shapirobacteria bacterium]
MIDPSTVKQLAQQFQIDEYSIYRQYLQISFLNAFYQQKHQNIFFKGGTALKLLYSSPRFSEDLDFSIQSSHRPKLASIIKSTMFNLRLSIPKLEIKQTKTPFGLSYKLYFPLQISQQPLTIKLDFSDRDKTKYPNQQTIQTLFPISTFSLIQAQSKKEILAEKIHALYFRHKGRDIYDIWYLLNTKTDFDIKLINYKLKKNQVKFNFEKTIHQIQNFSPKKLKQDLNNFLPISQRQLIPQLPNLIINQLHQLQP